VLTGDDAGGAFSAGANLKDPKTHTMDSVGDFIKSISKRRGRPFEVLSSFPKPIVGAVNGYAVGIGCIINLCCELLVCSETCEVLSSFPKPIVGACNGYAVGIGCIITFCCDLLVASERAEWRLPQVGLGILPAYGGSGRPRGRGGRG